MLNAQQHLPVRPNGHQLENTWWVCIKDTELFFHRLNMHKGSHLLPQQFWSQLILMCVSWRIKSQVLDKCKVLSADTGHHSETDCTALECGLVFLCALSCTQENPRPALYQTSAQFDLNRMHARRRTLRPPDWGERRRRQRLKSPPVSELFRETSTDWQSVFSPCSMALTLPTARPGVCRLCGLYQHAIQESKFIHQQQHRELNANICAELTHPKNLLSYWEK